MLSTQTSYLLSHLTNLGTYDMTTKNDITGDSLVSKPVSDTYRANYDSIQWSKEPENPTFFANTTENAKNTEIKKSFIGIAKRNFVNSVRDTLKFKRFRP